MYIIPRSDRSHMEYLKELFCGIIDMMSMCQKMNQLLLKITLDPALGKDKYANFDIEACTLYVKVMSVSERESVSTFVLEHCPLALDRFEKYPVMAEINHFSSSATILYCEWNENDEMGLNYVEIPVTVQCVDTITPMMRFK